MVRQLMTGFHTAWRKMKSALTSRNNQLITNSNLLKGGGPFWKRKITLTYPESSTIRKASKYISNMQFFFFQVMWTSPSWDISFLLANTCHQFHKCIHLCSQMIELVKASLNILHQTSHTAVLRATYRYMQNSKFSYYQIP